MNYKTIAGILGLAIASIALTSCKDCVSCKAKNAQGQNVYAQDVCGTSEDLKSVEDECLAKANAGDGECSCEN